MSGFSEKLRLKEQAEEDQWFARRDRELAAELKRRRAREAVPTLERLVCGGQTGVDRAALDVAQQLGISQGGWCPLGRKAEDGPIAVHYDLKETPTGDYSQRTEWNVRDSDATLILYRRRMSGGTALTARLARRMDRPLLSVDMARDPAVAAGNIREWLAEHRIKVLNVAGPRASGDATAYQDASDLLTRAFS